MKKKLLVIGILLLVILVVILYLFWEGKLKTQGSYYDNLADFAVEDNMVKENCSPLAQAYMKSITYKITETDTQKMEATIEVSVPQVKEGLTQIVKQVIKDNPEANVSNIEKIVEQNFQSQLESDALSRETITIAVPMERKLFKYKLVPDGTWYNVTMGQLEELYFEYFKLMIGDLTNEKPYD